MVSWFDGVKFNGRNGSWGTGEESEIIRGTGGDSGIQEWELDLEVKQKVGESGGR